MNRAHLLAMLFVTVAIACKEKEPPKTEATPTPVAQPAPVAVTAAAATTNEASALEQVAVAEDFEEQAITQITPENLDSELETLEKETND